MATTTKNEWAGARWWPIVTDPDTRFWRAHLEWPFRWKEHRHIFVTDMGADLFHARVTNNEIAAVFDVMAACPQHTFQLLTTRATRMCDWFHWYDAQPSTPTRWPLRNVWLGVSVEDQKTADERIPRLLDTPAAMRWVSVGPSIGSPIYVNHYMGRGISWLVIGCETGLGARPFNLGRALSRVRQWNVPCLIDMRQAHARD